MIGGGEMLKTLNQRISVTLFIIGIVYLILTYQLPSYPYTEIDADIIPTVLGWILVGLSIVLFFAKDSETDEQKQRRNIPKKDLLAIVIVFAFLFVYVLFLEILGFVIMTALFIFFCSWFLGYKKHITNVIVSILFPVIIYLMFTEFLKISLPQGILPL